MRRSRRQLAILRIGLPMRPLDQWPGPDSTGLLESWGLGGAARCLLAVESLKPFAFLFTLRFTCVPVARVSPCHCLVFRHASWHRSPCARRRPFGFRPGLCGRCGLSRSLRRLGGSRQWASLSCCGVSNCTPSSLSLLLDSGSRLWRLSRPLVISFSHLCDGVGPFLAVRSDLGSLPLRITIP